MFKDEIKKLSGTKLNSITRAADMCCLHFDVKDENDDQTYNLHFQCPWRLVKYSKNRILLTSYDIYVPNTSTEWDDDFEWDVLGNNLFDEITEGINESTDVYIEEVTLSIVNDLKLVLSNGYTFECFINKSNSYRECWRFFKGNEKHWVVYGNGKVK